MELIRRILTYEYKYDDGRQDLSNSIIDVMLTKIRLREHPYSLNSLWEAGFLLKNRVKFKDLWECMDYGVKYMEKPDLTVFSTKIWIRLCFQTIIFSTTVKVIIASYKYLKHSTRNFCVFYLIVFSKQNLQSLL